LRFAFAQAVNDEKKRILVKLGALAEYTGVSHNSLGNYFLRLKDKYELGVFKATAIINKTSGRYVAE